MRILLSALKAELKAIGNMDVQGLCNCLAMMGFPVDAVEKQLDGVVLEVDVTANRGDALSHRGLARDLAAKLGAPLTPVPAKELTEGLELLPISLEADACPLYATAVLLLDSTKIHSTPDDVLKFLVAMGSGGKGLVPVDASNALLHRYGHPTHAFDADKIKGGIFVRWAKSGETLLTLDGMKRYLDQNDMVIADESGPIALAGVIGGDATKVTENTKRVLLESAYFDPRTVRATARRLSIFTDSSHRFGRGADIAFVKTARDMLADTLISWGGAQLQSAWTVGRCETGQTDVFLQKNLIDRVAGEPIQLYEAQKILLSLGCQTDMLENGLNVRPPSWRHDLCIADDYTEEILRIRGYDRIGAALPPLEGSPLPLSNSYQQKRLISRRLAQLGFYQTLTLGFISPDADAKYAKCPTEDRTLLNPLGSEYSVMRASLLTSLWEVAEANQRNGAKDIRLFEIAPVYENALIGPVESNALCIVWAGIIGGDDPLSPARPVMVADLIAIARDLGFKGRPNVIDLGQNAYGLEILIAQLSGPTEQVIPTFRPFSRYPVMTRDLSLLAPLNLSYGQIKASFKKALESAPLQDARCVDVYKDRKLTVDGKQALLIRFKFQSHDKTLTGEEVDAWMQIALEASKQLGCGLR
jgi:phenylalanyl-tRNA synthetase beta chain